MIARALAALFAALIQVYPAIDKYRFVIAGYEQAVLSVLPYCREASLTASSINAMQASMPWS